MEQFLALFTPSLYSYVPHCIFVHLLVTKLAAEAQRVVPFFVWDRRSANDPWLIHETGLHNGVCVMETNANWSIKYVGSGSEVDSSACILNSEEKKEDLHMQQTYVDLLIDALLDEGFTVEEAIRLIHIQERYEEQRRQRRAIKETNHHRFIRWLVEHGRLSDW